jgi:hypothetical protein
VRRRGPLQSLSDSQVLKLAARHFARRAQELRDLVRGGGTLQGSVAVEYDVLSATAQRLRQLARRAPLWTERPWRPDTPSPYDLSER